MNNAEGHQKDLSKLNNLNHQVSNTTDWHQQGPHPDVYSGWMQGSKHFGTFGDQSWPGAHMMSPRNLNIVIFRSVNDCINYVE